MSNFTLPPLRSRALRDDAPTGAETGRIVQVAQTFPTYSQAPLKKPARAYTLPALPPRTPQVGHYSGPGLDARAVAGPVGKVVEAPAAPTPSRKRKAKAKPVDEEEVLEGDVVLDEDEYAAHKSSKKENYCTPASFLELVTELGPIVLDPCSNEHALTCARTEYRLDKGQDGLVLPWDLGGLVFCNPPYGRKLRAWLRLMCYWAARGVEIVGLVTGRPDTIGMQESTADLVCFWRGRLVFNDGDTGLPVVDDDGREMGAIFPQAVLYFGPQVERFEAVFSYDASRPKGQRGGKVVPWGGRGWQLR